MLKYTLVILIGCLTVFQSPAQQNQSQKSITTKQLNELLADSSQVIQLVDVRTPKEYKTGRISIASNADWTNPAFKTMVKALDTTQAIYVICLSGGRSAAAAEYLRNEGVRTVVEVEGGMLQWRAQGFAEQLSATETSTGMSVEVFQSLVEGEGLILVDFYADWCIPCRKMAPYLEKMAGENAKGVKIVRIDTEAHKNVSTAMQVQALPVLQLYRAGQKIWEHQGFLEEEAIKKVIKEHIK